MRASLFVVLAACGSSPDAPPAPAVAPPRTPDALDERAPATATPKTPDNMDERMRHCPLALDGATSTLEDIDGGVRFTIAAPDTAIDEARRRAHHIVEFAARRTREGHGGFDGKGGGRMKNCPVVTDAVTIEATDIPGGAQLDIRSHQPDQIAQLRVETRARASKFPFVGASIKIAAHK